MAEKKLSVSTVAARKAIERARKAGFIESSAPVRFDRTFLYYLADHRSKGKRYAPAVRKLLKTKPAHNRVFKTLLANKGWITFGQIGKASACLPEGETKRIGGRKAIERVIDDLLRLGIVEPVAGAPHIYRLGREFGSATISRGAFQHKLRIEQELLIAATEWLKNTYLLAYNRHTYRSSETDAEDFNHTYWDAHGPAYLGAFTRDPNLRRTTVKENFLVVEILAYRPFSIVDAEAIVERYRSVVLRWKTISLTPIVISRFFSQGAWQTLRRSGVGAVLLGDVFGKNIDALLQALWQTISDEKAPADQIKEIGETLAIAAGTVDDWGLVGNLKGTLFEFLIALAWKAAGYDVTLQKVVR